MTDDTRRRIIEQARARQGVPYRLSPPPDGINNLDCSLFVLQVLESAGVPLPKGVRTAEQIRQATVPVPFDRVQPGDLLFFEHTYDAAGLAGPDGRIASHIGISLGAGTLRMWDANDRHGVGETNVGTAYWQDRIFEARRVPGLQAAPMPSVLAGVDVASHQGQPDWRAVAGAGVAFAITKATGGTWYTNPTFARNWLEIKAAGMTRGAYHYAFESSGQPLPGDGPESEADYFVKAIERAGGVEAGDLLALDIEDGAGQLGEWCLRWLKRVEARTGVRPLVYTGAWFSGPHGLAASPELADYALWLAAYQAQMPAAPSPWSEVAIWQHTDKGTVPGIIGPVDMNRFDGTVAELRALGKPGATGVGTGPSATNDEDTILGLRAALAHIADVEAPRLAKAATERDAALAAIKAIREQFLGPRPAA